MEQHLGWPILPVRADDVTRTGAADRQRRLLDVRVSQSHGEGGAPIEPQAGTFIGVLGFGGSRNGYDQVTYALDVAPPTSRLPGTTVGHFPQEQLSIVV